MAEEECEKKIGFLDEGENNRSSMRLMCFISLLASIGFAGMTFFVKTQDPSTGLIITMSFLLGAFAPKALQKFMEGKIPGR
jgi:hypothetical protein